MLNVKISKVSIILATTSFLLGLFVFYQPINVSRLSRVLHDYSIINHASLRVGSDYSESTGKQQRLPKALIIGFMKCGTSTLRSFLTAHPDIVAPAKEIYFFLDYYDRGLDWYRRQMPLSLPHQITIEKSPGYILSYDAMQRIYAFNPEVKLLVIVRNPVSRLQSIYAHKMHSVPESERKTFTRWLTHRSLKEKVSKYADYSTDIRDALTVFPRDQFLFLSEEELETDPASVLKQVQSFLGLRPLFTDDMFIFDHQKGFYCVNKRHPLLPRMKGLVNITTGCMREGKGREHPEISDQLFRRIVAISKPYVGRLFKLIRKKFKWEHYPF